MRKLKSNSNVVDIIPNRAITPRILPNDPQINKQWQYVNKGSTGGINGADMDMDLAWDITTGGLSPTGDTIVVCVIDDVSAAPPACYVVVAEVFAKTYGLESHFNALL